MATGRQRPAAVAVLSPWASGAVPGRAGTPRPWATALRRSRSGGGVVAPQRRGLNKKIQAIWHPAPIPWALGAIFLVACFCVSAPANRRGKRWAELAATMGGLTFCSNCAQHAPSTPALTHVLRGTNPHSRMVECDHADVPGVVVGAFCWLAVVSRQRLLDAGFLAVCLLGLARLAAGAAHRPRAAHRPADLCRAGGPGADGVERAGGAGLEPFPCAR